MTVAVDSTETIEGRVWHILLLTVLVVLFLTLALIGLQFSAFFDEEGVVFLSRESYKYTISLAIFILLFCAYVVTNQRKLLLISRAYSGEMRDKQTLSEDVETLRTILEVSSVVGSQQSLGNMLNAITREIVKCFQADQSSIMLVDHQTGTIKTQASYAVGEHPAKNAAVPLGKSVSGWVVEKGTPLLLHGEIGRDDYPGKPSRQRAINSSMCVPLTIRGKTIGVLNVNRMDVLKRFTESDLQLLSVFANNAAGAIYNAKLLLQIRSFNVRLEEKVRQRTMELERANQAKSDFLAGMSHELRTPLNSINGFSQVLLKRHFGELTPKQEHYVGNILESGQHLLALINDILDLSKVEAGRFELETSRLPIRRLIEESLEMLRPQAGKKSLALTLEWPEHLSAMEVTADERRLKQVLLNLLTNAVKFTPVGGTVTVRVRETDDIETLVDGSEGNAVKMARTQPQSAGPFLAVSVIDTGLGISPEDQERIFDQFYQVKGGLRDKSPGTGLGLNLAQRLVELHGGTMWVHSGGADRGSEFSFVLPVESRCVRRPSGTNRQG